MTTKPLVRSLDISVATSSEDVSTLNRLLAAAAINACFRSTLLSDPKSALQTGFGGELFPFSQPTYQILVSIRADNLPEFVRKLNARKANFAL